MNAQLEKYGFAERHFHTGEVAINFVVGPNNGIPLLLIPAQMGMWETYLQNFPLLSRQFQVYAVDVRGHGKSDWTTGDYSWASIGRDMSAFMRGIVQRPAIVSGNSSGGLIALWIAANISELTAGLVLEDAPVFSAEMPRFKETDRFVYQGLEHLVKSIGDPDKRDLADYFRGQTLPVNGGKREKRVPDWVADMFSFFIRRYQAKHPGQAVDIPYFPGSLRSLFKSLSMFDPDFARAFVDGRFYNGLNHADALRRVHCPVLIMHANWFRHVKYGLVGAMDDADAGHIQELVPQAEYIHIPANHVIHRYKADAFNQALIDFAIRHQLISPSLPVA